MAHYYESSSHIVTDYDWYYGGVMERTDIDNDPFLISQVNKVIELLIYKNIISRLTETNIRRVIITAAMLVAKFNLDDASYNTSYSCLSGVPLKELNFLERHMLHSIGWDLFSIFNQCSINHMPIDH